MNPILLAGAAVLLLAAAPVRADDTLGFLQRKNMTTPQSTPLPMPVTSAAEQQRNKQVVLDFYKLISDHRAWTAANRDKYFAPDFRQHDPAEPSTSKAFFDYFNQMMPPPSAGGKPRPRMMMVGTTANDSNGSPVNWMVAEGNAVVVIRHRNWPWPNGPQPVYSGIFVDVWLLKDGKITDQWCSCTPADANLPHIFAAMKAGDFPKTPE